MHEIIPAVLAYSEVDFKEKIAALPSEITFIHVDVLEEDIWAPIQQDFEAHIMAKDPISLIPRWVERGAKRISIHTVDGSLTHFRDKVEIGLAIELDKPIEEVMPFLDFVDYIHLMSIDEIGAQGHPLDERIFKRLDELQKKFPNVPISVDGGVNKRNYEKLLSLGADRLIVGSGFKELWQALKTT